MGATPTHARYRMPNISAAPCSQSAELLLGTSFPLRRATPGGIGAHRGAACRSSQCSSDAPMYTLFHRTITTILRRTPC